jgi:amino acid adenylation domain-containing protein
MAVKKAYPDVCVHALFEQQAARTPDALAVVSAEECLTYRELNERANQVAHYLRRRGVGPETLVGVCMQRSPRLVIGLLGVWKAGGAYVPMDPTYPTERLAFMLEDANLRVLLTDGRSRCVFPSAADRTLCLELHWPLIECESTANLPPAAGPSNLAYVMYTSGSTGRPKGAMILHRGLVNYLCWAIDAYGVQSSGSVPVHSSISFDLTVTSLYPPLLTGGQVELLPEEGAAQALLAALRQKKDRTLVKITPAHLELLSAALRPEEAAGLTQVFVIGGENLLAEKLRFWREFAPRTRLINEYGPTETVVGCCVYEVRGDDPHSGPVPIGHPIANTELYVLDADAKPVPDGVAGELCIGGAGVARGYLNRPELTQQRFIADPFSGREGASLYKTGDLARRRADGVFEYLGRVDDQVKIRGYRIELGEIEATLASHPAIGSCTVIARETMPGEHQLMAYVTAVQGASVKGQDFHLHLKQKLPEYMLPAHYVFMDALPLTPNGKVDRKALPAPTREDASADEGYAAPRTETELALARIWAGLLGIERIGIHDDVFDLGAHSLLAMRAVTQIRQQFDVNLQLRNLFEQPTPAGLAQMIDAMSWNSKAPPGTTPTGIDREETVL